MTKFQGVTSRAMLEIKDNNLSVQFCGPISTGGLGNAEENIECLESFIIDSIKMGIPVFNQLKYENDFNTILGPMIGYDHDLLEYFYRPIFESGLIKYLIFLPNWETSYGCKWEMDLALKLGIQIIVMDDYLVSNLELRKLTKVL